MGQKINPIALRLSSSTKKFDNSWYSDYYYKKLLFTDLSIMQYLNVFFKFLKLPEIRLSICHLPKTTKLYTFFCYPRQSRELKSRIYQIASQLPHFNLKKQKSLKKNSLYQPFLNKYKIGNSQQCLTNFILWQKVKLNTKKKIIPDFINNLNNKLKCNILIQDVIDVKNINFDNNKNNGLKIKGIHFKLKTEETSKLYFNKLWKSLYFLKLSSTNKINSYKYNEFQLKQIFKLFIVLNKNTNFNKKINSINITKWIFTKLYLDDTINLANQNFSNSFNWNEKKLKYKNYLQNYLSNFYNSNIEIIPFKTDHDWQTASYFADELIYLLERRISFRRIKTQILKQIQQNSEIRGVRIICSGRVGGKSKKAQRAKIESIKYGQTSLHVFSSKIDFASRTAYTALGSTGIKVWICYS